MRWIKLIYVTLLFILFGCGKNNHSQDKITIEPINALKEHNTAQWVKPGVESYGICVLQLEDEKHAKPIKIKILHVRSNEIKVKSIENITFEPNNNCEKTKVSYGESYNFV